MTQLGFLWCPFQMGCPLLRKTHTFSEPVKRDNVKKTPPIVTFSQKCLSVQCSRIRAISGGTPHFLSVYLQDQAGEAVSVSCPDFRGRMVAAAFSLCGLASEHLVLDVWQRSLRRPFTPKPGFGVGSREVSCHERNPLKQSMNPFPAKTNTWLWVEIQIVPPVNMPIPTKIGSKMGGEFTYQPKWDPKTVITTAAFSLRRPS